jgi:hypothetical protein
MTEAKCGRCGVPIGEGTKQTQWYFEPDETAFCRECAMAHIVHEHETIAELEAENKKLKAQLAEAIRVSGEALGTAPELRSVACVTALAQWCEELKAEAAKLRETVEKCKADADQMVAYNQLCVRWLAELRAKCEEAIPFIMTGDVCDLSHAVGLLRVASGKEESRNE